MSFSFAQVALISFMYVAMVFGIAYSTERNWIPDKVTTHPITYILSLGIFASAWAFYGVIELADRFGYGALAYYIGTGLLFLFGGFALRPLVELAKRFQINSMADLLVFRYHSHLVGALVTLLMLLAMLPLIALQIQAVADTMMLLIKGQEQKTQIGQLGMQQSLGLVYCLGIAVFAVLFGANREHHKGLINAMAFESLIKLLALLIVGGYVVSVGFGGLSGLDDWLSNNPHHALALYTASDGATAHTLMLVFIATAVSMPHIFHMTVVENPVRQSSSLASWAFPLFLLLMALPIFPILWGGYHLSLDIPAQYFPLAIPLANGNPLIAILAYIGGLSAATGALVAMTLALTTMILNQWILPSNALKTKRDLYRQLIWMRRGLITFIVLVGFAFYLLLNNQFTLTQLALTAFIGTLQLLPSVLGVTHWPKINRRGLVAGVAAGGGTWFVGLFVPLILGQHHWSTTIGPVHIITGVDAWQDITLWSLGINALACLIVSRLTRQSDDERYSAELCSQDELSHPVRLTLDIRSPDEIIDRLSTRIGASTAKAEVERALHRLNIKPNENRPFALRRLRDELEANLSSLMGIAMASDIIDRLVPYKVPEAHDAPDINLIESRLVVVRDQLTGLAAELNNLRLYHRKTLEQLPLPTCSIGQDLEILMWNSAMTKLTGIERDEVTGSHIKDIRAPWGSLLHRFSNSSEHRFYKRQIELNQRPHWITLHKASIPSSLSQQSDGQVIILEDVTELQLLEQELLHSERLASVGRLAAGVAHEIGNPVTGIACLAQNMRYDTEDPEVLECIEHILSQTDRVSRIVQTLVSFSHAGQQTSDHMHSVSLRDCAQEAISLLSLQQEKHQVNFVNEVPESLSVYADSQRLIQVFVNLLSNSRDASPLFGDVIVAGSSNPQHTTITVTDFGSGIPQELQDRIFEPFFTTKEPGEGTGLGLAMVYSIIEDHKGGLDIESPAHQDTTNGTRFIITLPNQNQVDEQGSSSPNSTQSS
ncbi:ATP-binding protein [Marinagarivorans algicola]|uniref:ATP-binding protein n=1 Tax=Marinagarivorans algicola TaxID=1513270 RepID=UPI0006B5293E|nr:ATP-binding protein [Marinagarivorans algicola]